MLQKQKRTTKNMDQPQKMVPAKNWRKIIHQTIPAKNYLGEDL
jgi:hypothetical protein